MANLFDKVGDLINASLDSRISALKKSEGDNLSKAIKEDGGIGRKGLLFDPFTEQSYSGSLFKPKATFLSNHILKMVSRRDPIVAAIVDTRSNQVASFCKKQPDRFGQGFKFIAKNGEVRPDPDKIRKAEEFVLNCGNPDGRSEEDKMTFDQWGYCVTRDLLVYGHSAIERVPSQDGEKLGAFLPLASETIYFANKEVEKDKFQFMRDVWRRGVKDDIVSAEQIEGGDALYCQVIDGKVTEVFSKEELIFVKFNTESDIDLRGYCVGPLERAVAAITDHLKIENHQRGFFTHGLASRGLLFIQGDVSPQQLRTLQSQWTQQTSGSLNAWRTPVLAGVNGVDWVSLSASNRDMEFAAYQDHVLRTIFSCFAMDPEEAGFGYLSKGVDQKSMGESSNEWKITASRDRGLRPILGRIEAVINEVVLPAYDKNFSKDYHFTFVGLDAETEIEETERLTAETQLHTTLNEAREQVDKKPMELGGGLILNAALIQTLRTSMPFGLWLEKFIGIPGASERPDLQFIDNPSWFQWQQVQMQLMQMQAGAAIPQDGEEDGDGGDDQGPPSKGKKKDKSKKDDDDKEQDPDGDDQMDQEAMQAQAQMQAQAVNQYIMLNPELFKSYNKAKDLAKAEAAPKQIRDTHVDRMTKDLTKEFRQASTRLIDEVFKVIDEEMDDGSQPEGPAQDS